MKDEKVLARNIKSVEKKSGDTSVNVFVYRSAIGITKKRKADVAWIGADSSINFLQYAKDPTPTGIWYRTNASTGETKILSESSLKKWKVQTAVGGGPVLLQNGEIKITNNEEMMFAGKAMNNKEPRTAMGYTKDGRLIILVVQGRFPGIAEGAALPEEARIFKDLGCWEALNLDGGGSSCLLINGKNTIEPSSKGVQRPVPAVFLIKGK
jgi:uncharacterized protein YigE (DUF2233 family)